MPAELRGLTFALALLAVLLGVLLCAFPDKRGLADVIILTFIGFYFLCGVLLKYGDNLRSRDLLIASVIPPATGIAYLVIAVSELNCVAITAGLKVPTPGFLGRLLFYAAVLVWLGIGASTTVRAAARWYDSRKFLAFLQRQTRRMEAIGKFVDKVSGLSKIASAVRRLFQEKT